MVGGQTIHNRHSWESTLIRISNKHHNICHSFQYLYTDDCQVEFFIIMNMIKLIPYIVINWLVSLSCNPLIFYLSYFV